MTEKKPDHMRTLDWSEDRETVIVEVRRDGKKTNVYLPKEAALKLARALLDWPA